MRTINTTLENALATQQGDIILRVLTWTDQADYNANPTTPDHTWETKKFFIGATSADAELVTANDYTLSAFSVFIIERGVLLAGTEYTIQSGLFFVKTYQEDYGKIKLHGSSYPNLKIHITAGDGTYQEVIEAFCTAIGKTAVFKNATDTWLSYQFLPTGKSLSLNKAELFENLLKQKYTILVYEESPGNLIFYNQDSFLQTILLSIAWSPELSLFCAVASVGTNLIMTSPDGVTWTPRTAVESNFWRSITWSPSLSLFCAVAQTGTNRVMTSPDGITWTARTAAEANLWNSITWSPSLSLFCAVSSTGTNRVMTSPDGITWTARTAAEANTWNSVTWSPSLSLFCAVSSTGTNRVMTSPDGITWTARTAAQSNTWNSVTWSPSLSLFCAVSSTGTNRVMTSPDGITWTARTAAEANTWNSVTWSPSLSLFCAVAQAGTNRVMTSPDGITWTARTAAQSNTWNSVTWSPSLSLFCAVSGDGESRVMTSPDGVAWTAQTNNTTLALSYLDSTKSYLIRDQAAVHYLWRDEAATLHTLYDTTLPQWNLGFLESAADAPTTHEDAYYKIFLQKAPVRLDITDGDKIHFTPYWSIDPTKTIDAMMQVSEHLDLTKSPSWWQEIKSISLFSHTEGGALPSTIERVAAYTPLVSTGFDGNLSPAVNNLQALAQAVDDMNGGNLLNIVPPAVNVLTILNAAAATLALNITATKTLTLTCAGDYTLTVPGTGVALVKATALTAGYIPFGIAGNLVGEDAGLFWDNTNKRLGIGTAAPGAKLEVAGSGTGRIFLGQWTLDSSYGAIGLAGSISSTDANFYSSVTDTNLYINRPSGKDIYFREAGANQVTIKTGGNVGIGTTSPGYKLDVAAAAANGLGLQIKADGSADTVFNMLGNTSGTQQLFSIRTNGAGAVHLNTQNSARLSFGVNTGSSAGSVTEHMVINSSGNVGIGTTGPNAAAILELASTTKGFRLPNMTTTQRNAISSPPPGLMVFDTTLDFIYRVKNDGTWSVIIN